MARFGLPRTFALIVAFAMLVTHIPEPHHRRTA